MHQHAYPTTLLCRSEEEKPAAASFNTSHSFFQVQQIHFYCAQSNSRHHCSKPIPLSRIPTYLPPESERGTHRGHCAQKGQSESVMFVSLLACSCDYLTGTISSSWRCLDAWLECTLPRPPRRLHLLLPLFLLSCAIVPPCVFHPVAVHG